MAVTSTIAQAELGRIMSAAYSGKVLTAALINASSPPDVNDSIAAWIRYELTEGTNGYARFQSSALTGGSYDAVDGRYEQDVISVEFAASGGTLTYTHVLLLLDAAADGQAGASITASTGVNTSTDTLTATAHGLSDGNAVTITADAGGSLPTGLSAGVLYYVDSTGTDTVTLHTATPVSGSNRVDLTTTGSGTLRLRKCAGSVYGVLAESSAVSIADGQTIAYNVTLAVND